MDSGWAAVIVAGVAAIVAAWQAWDARKARKEAQTARDDAEAHEQAALAASREAAGAAQRGADAQERIADVAEKGVEKPTWKLKKTGPDVWALRNVSGHALSWAAVLNEDERLQAIGGDSDGLFEDIGPNAAISLHFRYHLGETDWVTFTVQWVTQFGDQRAEAFTLQWKPPATAFAGF
ncbi:hypothetical protein ACNUCX_11340 [Curtobacterium flaccumfaciens pv. flaccumfaciens]|uniref:hypothetical protein n=1 Tax=Curtobacterium flaccumfaciens TaxID=2035 RepID=UPI003AB1918C